MPTAISDGTGTGSLAKVTDGRLQVEANLRPFISYKAKGSAQSFAAASYNTTGLAAGADVYNVRYTGSSGGFVITEIVMFSNQIVVVSAQNSTGTAAGGDAITPAQLNFGSTSPSNITVRAAGTTGALSGLSASGSPITYFQLPAVGTIPVEPGEIPIVTASRSLTINIKSVPGSNPTVMGITVFGYESDLEL